MMKNTARLSRRKRRWLAAAILLVTSMLACYIFRSALEQSAIAITIWHEHIFHPPAGVTTGEAARFYWDVAALRVAREKRVNQFNPVLKPLVKEIAHRQGEHSGMQYSMHIYREVRWLLNFTNDTATIRAKINQLKVSLDDTAAQRKATLQQPEDGSWGLGIDTWYLRLYYTVEDGLDNLKTNPPYHMAVLDKINSSGLLRARLTTDLYDDFTKTHVFNREELDETFSAVARLLHKTRTFNYSWQPGVDTALQNFVGGWQNPETGCWGQWMIDREGKIWKMDDMAMTFHVVSDFHGSVNHLDKIAKRILELKDLDFPSGVKFDGEYSNHLNWDVVKIMRYAWPQLDSATKNDARIMFTDMLKWCLANSYRPDGSFATSELDDTYGDAVFYGVSFLVDLGYFDRAKRFWTDADFPGSQKVHDQIVKKLQQTGTIDPQLKDSYDLIRQEPGK